MPSARREIQEKLIDILETITVSNGYHHDVAAATKKLKGIEQISSFPELCVIEGEQVFHITSEEENLYEVTSTFSVIGYVKVGTDADDAGILSDACDDLLEDIRDALLDNAGVLFSETAAKSIRFLSDEPVLDYQNNWGHITVNFSVMYYYGTGA
ncbi:MAG: hypothetical protein ACHQQQ_00080 [Bacteroidota bacterium]